MHIVELTAAKMVLATRSSHSLLATLLGLGTIALCLIIAVNLWSQPFRIANVVVLCAVGLATIYALLTLLSIRSFRVVFDFDEKLVTIRVRGWLGARCHRVDWRDVHDLVWRCSERSAFANCVLYLRLTCDPSQLYLGPADKFGNEAEAIQVCAQVNEFLQRTKGTSL